MELVASVSFNCKAYGKKSVKLLMIDPDEEISKSIVEVELDTVPKIKEEWSKQHGGILSKTLKLQGKLSLIQEGI